MAFLKLLLLCLLMSTGRPNMTEFEQELVKEILAEAQMAKDTAMRSFERLEKLAQRLLKEAEKKTNEPVA
jgi:hypothetical protein